MSDLAFFYSALEPGIDYFFFNQLKVIFNILEEIESRDRNGAVELVVLKP